jgi:hypothetical protein
MSSLDIAPHPEGAPTRVRDQRKMRHRLRVSFRRAGICTIWRLGFRQFSFHRIARVPRRTVPDTWTRPPVSCHALFPLTFRRQVRHRTQGPPSNPSRLRRGYNEAPRGAPLSCRNSDAGTATRNGSQASSSTSAVSSPPASPVLTTLLGSSRSTAVSASARGQCSTPRGTTKSSRGPSTTS